jgi:two-component system chemotaxis response regulator CheY
MNSSHKQILVIEDHECVRVLLGSWLKKQNYQVTTKADGFEGMMWLDEGNIPDLILLDMNMPRVNGNDFLRNIRNSGFFRNIPVIVVSGTETQSEIEQCIDLGARGFLKKPFNPSNLNDKIGSILFPPISNPLSLA